MLEEKLSPCIMLFSVTSYPYMFVKIFIKYKVTTQRLHNILKPYKAFTTGVYKLFNLKEALGIIQCEVFFGESVEYCSYGRISN